MNLHLWEEYYKREVTPGFRSSYSDSINTGVSETQTRQRHSEEEEEDCHTAVEAVLVDSCKDPVLLGCSHTLLMETHQYRVELFGLADSPGCC